LLLDQGLGCCASEAEQLFVRPSDVKGLLAAHEAATGITHELAALSDSKKVQQLLSSERHEATFRRLKSKLGVRSYAQSDACLFDASRQ
jgi:hypothetical protein